MKKINIDEQKRILIEILEYVDSVCRKNGIKYTLIGGSLIGAVRHKGIIPWDDDVDIALLSDQYDRLIRCLEEDNNNDFHLLTVDTENSYYYPFAKVVKSSTFGYEKNLKKINKYGIYIDIFKFNSIPNDINNINNYYNKMMKIRKRLAETFCYQSKSKIIRCVRHITCKFNSNKIARDYIKFTEKYNGRINSDKIISNWTAYGIPNEILNINNFKKYIDVEFDGITVMIVADYDKVLTNIFGNYMKLPPKNKQISHHNMVMYETED